MLIFWLRGAFQRLSVDYIWVPNALPNWKMFNQAFHRDIWFTPPNTLMQISFGKFTIIWKRFVDAWVAILRNVSHKASNNQLPCEKLRNDSSFEISISFLFHRLLEMLNKLEMIHRMMTLMLWECLGLSNLTTPVQNPLNQFLKKAGHRHS